MRDPLDTSSILAAATVADLRSDAEELAALARETMRPIPVLPLGAVEREATLTILLLQARDRARRLLSLVERGM